MPKIQSFRDLIAWQQAMELADMVYDLTENLPARERLSRVVTLIPEPYSLNPNPQSPIPNPCRVPATLFSRARGASGSG